MSNIENYNTIKNREILEHGCVKNVLIDKNNNGRNDKTDRYRISIPAIIAEEMGISREDKIVKMRLDSGKLVIEKL